MTIPIANIYYLLCYAWNQLEESRLVEVDTSEARRPAELFAMVLAGGVSHLLKRGLDRGYVTRHEELSGIRGRLDVAASVKHLSLQRARAWCAHDEFTADVLHNRVVKATLRLLARVSDLESALRDRLHELYRRMPDVREERPSLRAFGRVVLHRNNAFYGFVLNVCELVQRNLLVDERTGRTTFRDFTRDEGQMNRLFERFLFEFYRRELAGWRVTRPILEWRRDRPGEDDDFLPQMRTDLVLESPDRVIIADAKYYRETLTERFGKRSINAGNLYQLFAYLSNLSVDVGTRELSGLLIYPRTAESVWIDVTLHSYPVRVASIDLSRQWSEIAADLLQLVHSPKAEAASSTLGHHSRSEHQTVPNRQLMEY